MEHMKIEVERQVAQQAFAVDAGIDRTYVSRLERGMENPTVAVLEGIAAALDVGAEALFAAPAPLPGGWERDRLR